MLYHVQDERKAGNPVAGLIDDLALDRNRATLLLSNAVDGDSDDEEAMTRPASKVGHWMVHTQTLCARPEAHAMHCLPAPLILTALSSYRHAKHPPMVWQVVITTTVQVMIKFASCCRSRWIWI